jgi:hypothetical protein
LSRKKANLRTFEEIVQNVKADELVWNSEKLPLKIRLQSMTQEERVREASKPLYLKRYE